MNVSSNIKKASKADIGGTKKNKVDVSFALFFASNHIKIKNAPSEIANICHDIAKIKSFEKNIVVEIKYNNKINFSNKFKDLTQTRYSKYAKGVLQNAFYKPNY